MKVGFSTDGRTAGTPGIQGLRGPGGVSGTVRARVNLVRRWAPPSLSWHEVKFEVN